MANNESFPKSNFNSPTADGVTLNNKISVLTMATYASRPEPRRDFRGRPGFPSSMIDQDMRELKATRARRRNNHDANANIAANDRFARLAEPVLTLILNDDRLFPTRESFAHIASEYDDECKGTDVVLCVNDKDGGRMMFSMDVSTGTKNENVAGKFDTSEKYNMVADIHYCLHGRERWSSYGAPHFIVGMSPASLQKAMEKVRVGNSNNGTIGREPDPDSDFIVLSEMWEQTKMQLAILKNDSTENDGSEETAQKQKMIAQLSSLGAAIKGSLMKKLDIDDDKNLPKEERLSKLSEAYSAKVDEQVKKDAVYANIMAEAKRRCLEVKKKARGAKTLGTTSSNSAMDKKGE